MRTRIVLSPQLAALALVAVGCGGDDEPDTDPTAAWASDFCSAVTTWTDELQTVTSEFSDTSNLSQDGPQSAAGRRQGVDRPARRRPPRPRRAGDRVGEEVQSALDSLSTTLETESDEHRGDRRRHLGPHRIPSAITAVTASLSAMGTAFSTTLQTIENADVESELQNALEDSPECADITS